MRTLDRPTLDRPVLVEVQPEQIDRPAVTAGMRVIRDAAGDAARRRYPHRHCLACDGRQVVSLIPQTVHTFADAWTVTVTCPHEPGGVFVIEDRAMVDAYRARRGDR